MGLEMKPVGEPYAGNPHVRFDDAKLAKDARIREASGPVRGDPVTLDQEAPHARVATWWSIAQ